jgi:hypothetical protein
MQRTGLDTGFPVSLGLNPIAGYSGPWPADVLRCADSQPTLGALVTMRVLPRRRCNERITWL